MTQIRISPSGRFAEAADLATVTGGMQLFGTADGKTFAAFTVDELSGLGAASIPHVASASVSPGAHSNSGATASVTLTLGTVTAGAKYRFTVAAAYPLVVQAPAGTTIRVGTEVSADGGSITSDVVGACVELIAESTGVFVATSAMQVW